MVQEIKIENGQVLVNLSGKMYVEEAGDLRNKLLEYANKGYKTFIMNFHEVDYIDSAGLGVLVSIQKRALQNGGGIAIKGLKGAIKELFELTRLNRVFEIH